MKWLEPVFGRKLDRIEPLMHFINRPKQNRSTSLFTQDFLPSAPIHSPCIVHFVQLIFVVKHFIYSICEAVNFAFVSSIEQKCSTCIFMLYLFSFAIYNFSSDVSSSHYKYRRFECRWICFICKLVLWFTMPPRYGLIVPIVSL